MSTLQIIEELETWNIYLVPHPSDRALDQLYNITLVAMATEENNNTNITCNEIDPFDFFPMGSNSKARNLISIGKCLLVRSVKPSEA